MSFKKMIRCQHCKKWVPANPRLKKQEYCNRKECQRARKAKWRRKKMAQDAQFRESQNDAQEIWRQNNPDYWKKYGERKKELRNRLEKQESEKRATHIPKIDSSEELKTINSRGYPNNASDFAKIDASEQINLIKPGIYYILTDPVKIDASMQKFKIIPVT